VKRPRITRKGLTPLALLALGATGLLLLVLTRPRTQTIPLTPPAPLVRVLQVQPQRLRLEVRTHGSVQPRTESNLVAQVSGPILWTSSEFVPGGIIAAGEPLLRIESADYEAALEAARANVAQSESELARAAKELSRRRGLAARDATSAAQLDDAVLRERVATAALRSARAERARAKRDLERTELLAPFDGRLREKHVDVGEFVNRGSPVARIYATDYAEVRLPVSNRDLQALDLPAYYRGEGGGGGPDVVLEADLAGVAESWSARVVRAEGEVDASSRMFHIVARVDDPLALREQAGAPPLVMGLFVDATILGREVDDVVVLPRSTLRDGNRVLVVDAEDRLHFRDVEVLRATGDRAVISGGLQAGERVCVSPIDVVVEGMQVRVAAAGGNGSGAP
jgi:RND family efflux transporter MFP subunit